MSKHSETQRKNSKINTRNKNKNAYAYTDTKEKTTYPVPAPSTAIQSVKGYNKKSETPYQKVKNS